MTKQEVIDRLNADADKAVEKNAEFALGIAYALGIVEKLDEPKNPSSVNFCPNCGRKL